jgi:hypothetical protein
LIEINNGVRISRLGGTGLIAGNSAGFYVVLKAGHRSAPRTLAPSIFDCDRAALSETAFGEALANGC